MYLAIEKLKAKLQKSGTIIIPILSSALSSLRNIKKTNFKVSNIFALTQKKFYVSQGIYWKRIFNLTFKSLARNKFISFVTIFVLSLIVLMFNITFAVNYITNEGIKNIGQKIDIIVWIEDDASSFEIESLQNDLKKLPEVKELIYTSKEEALTNFQKENSEVYSFIKQYDLENPLPASLGIIARNVEDNFKIMDFLKSDRYAFTLDKDKIQNNIEERKRIEKFLNITNFIYTSGQYLVGLFILVLIFITLNTINMLINRRAKEILIMRLVGAKYTLIRLPFILEGILYVLGAFIVGLILMYYFAYTFQTQLSTTLTDDSLLKGISSIINLFLEHFNTILFYEIIIAIAIGIFSSYLAIEWYLRKQNLLTE